jgi:hypothetical protein
MSFSHTLFERLSLPLGMTVPSSIVLDFSEDTDHQDTPLPTDTDTGTDTSSAAFRAQLRYRKGTETHRKGYGKI